jgi:hypothetical protein
MYTVERTTADSRLQVAGLLGLLAALCIAVDSLFVDAFGNEDVLPNLVGVAAPPLGIVVITGIYARLVTSRPGRLLDAGFLVSVVGLALVTAIDFSRTLVLARLDDAVVDDLLASGPTRPAFFAAALIYVAGSVLLGAALVRRGFAVPAAWLYAVTAVPSGLVVLLPDVVGAVAQTLAAVAVAGLSWRLYQLSVTAGPSPGQNG